MTCKDTKKFQVCIAAVMFFRKKRMSFNFFNFSDFLNFRKSCTFAENLNKTIRK